MPRSLNAEYVDTFHLSCEERRALSDALFAVHARIFAGTDQESFHRYVLSPQAQLNRLCVYRDGAGRVVGYCSLQRQDLDLDLGRLRVLRGVMGFLPEHRGKTQGARFYARHTVEQVLGGWLRGRSCFLLGTLVGPWMYLALARAMAEIWPSPNTPTPAPMAARLEALARAYSLPMSDRPGTCAVGWVSRQSAEETRRLEAHTDPAVRLFLSANPAYQQGQGLLVLVPLHLQNICHGLWRALRTRRRRRSFAAEVAASTPATPRPRTHG